MADDEMTLSQVAQVRGLNVRTLEYAARQHELRGTGVGLRARRLGHFWVTTLAAVDEWLAGAGQRTGPKPGTGKGRPRQERHAHGGNDGD
jgi:hypothetical protein